MKHSSLVLILAIAVAFASGQEKKGAPPGTEEMMKKMMELGAPGEHHKKLDALVGSWETTMSMWMEGPGKPPARSKGSAEFRWVLGGRYLVQEVKGMMMGMPMNGIGYNGYDNLRKKYTMFWIDDMGTVMSTGDGNYDASGKVLTLYGKMDDPTTDEYDKNVKYVTRWVGDNTFVFEMYDLAIGGADTKVMEINYERTK